MSRRIVLGGPTGLGEILGALLSGQSPEEFFGNNDSSADSDSSMFGSNIPESGKCRCGNPDCQTPDILRAAAEGDPLARIMLEAAGLESGNTDSPFGSGSPLDFLKEMLTGGGSRKRTDPIKEATEAEVSKLSPTDAVLFRKLSAARDTEIRVGIAKGNTPHASIASILVPGLVADFKTEVTVEEQKRQIAQLEQKVSETQNELKQSKRAHDSQKRNREYYEGEYERTYQALSETRRELFNANQEVQSLQGIVEASNGRDNRIAQAMSEVVANSEATFTADQVFALLNNIANNSFNPEFSVLTGVPFAATEATSENDQPVVEEAVEGTDANNDSKQTGDEPAEQAAAVGE